MTTGMTGTGFWSGAGPWITVLVLVVLVGVAVVADYEAGKAPELVGGGGGPTAAPPCDCVAAPGTFNLSSPGDAVYPFSTAASYLELTGTITAAQVPNGYGASVYLLVLGPAAWAEFSVTAGAAPHSANWTGDTDQGAAFTSAVFLPTGATYFFVLWNPPGQAAADVDIQQGVVSEYFAGVTT